MEFVAGSWLLVVRGLLLELRPERRAGRGPQTTSNQQPATPFRALLSALCALLLTTCAPVTDELTIEPSESGEMILVTATTTFALQAQNDRDRARVEAARAAALSGTDAWAIRFGRLTPEEEQVTYAKSRGLLERVTRSVRIADEDLQQVFSDANITVDVLHGEGWHELTFYPGSSTRATREQRKGFEGGLAQWSEGVARYFRAVDHLYTYLDEKPQRARDVFAALLTVEGPEPVVSDEERPLLEEVGRAMEDIFEKMNDQEGRNASFAEEADLIFNPFPARVTLRLPGEILSNEGFAKKEKEALVIEPVNLYAAIAGLEGEWISPDPLAALLREQAPTPEEMAALPRHSQKVVSSSEVARAITSQLTTPKTYRVRWRG